MVLRVDQTGQHKQYVYDNTMNRQEQIGFNNWKNPIILEVWVDPEKDQVS